MNNSAGLVRSLLLGLLAASFLPARLLIDGRQPFSVFGTLLIGVGLGALGISHSYPVLLATLFIMGIGAGILDMVLSPIVAALQPHKRATALNWLHSFYGIGTVIAVVMGTLTLRSGIDWHWMSLALVGIPLVVALGFVNLDLPPLTPGEEGRRKSLHDLCRTSSFLAINLAIFLGGALELGMAQWLPAYAEMSLGFTCYRLLLLIRVPFQA